MWWQASLIIYRWPLPDRSGRDSVLIIMGGQYKVNPSLKPQDSENPALSMPGTGCFLDKADGQKFEVAKPMLTAVKQAEKMQAW